MGDPWVIAVNDGFSPDAIHAFAQLHNIFDVDIGFVVPLAG